MFRGGGYRTGRLGFTLAEVLITLGLIGIVSALTLPSLINKYKIKQLETSFKQTSSLIQNALSMTANEFGFSNPKDFNNICGTLPESQTYKCTIENKDYLQEINDDFLSRFTILKRVSFFSADWFNYKVYPFGEDKSEYGYYRDLLGLYQNYLYYLPNGATISKLNFFSAGKYDGISISFDTNGPNKGPNRYGYDIFLYSTGTWYGVCSKAKSPASIPLGNGRGCYNYALKNVNPEDKTKGYWESLK